MYSVMYAVFDSKENCIARGNAPTLDRAKQLAEAPRPEPLLRTVIETNGTTIIRHCKKPGRGWEEQAQKGRDFEKFQRPTVGSKDVKGKITLLFPERKAGPVPLNVNDALDAPPSLGNDEPSSVTKDNV